MTKAAFPILFITADRIGDAVLSSGLIKRLADEIPNARFTIVGGARRRAAVRRGPDPRPDHRARQGQGRGGHWFDLWRQVRSTRWGLVVDLRGSASRGSCCSAKRARSGARVRGPPVHKVIEAARILKIEDEPAAAVPLHHAGDRGARRRADRRARPDPGAGARPPTGSARPGRWSGSPRVAMRAAGPGRRPWRAAG